MSTDAGPTMSQGDGKNSRGATPKKETREKQPESSSEPPHSAQPTPRRRQTNEKQSSGQHAISAAKESTKPISENSDPRYLLWTVVIVVGIAATVAIVYVLVDTYKTIQVERERSLQEVKKQETANKELDIKKQKMLLAARLNEDRLNKQIELQGKKIEEEIKLQREQMLLEAEIEREILAQQDKLEREKMDSDWQLQMEKSAKELEMERERTARHRMTMQHNLFDALTEQRVLYEEQTVMNHGLLWDTTNTVKKYRSLLDAYGNRILESRLIDLEGPESDSPVILPRRKRSHKPGQ